MEPINLDPIIAIIESLMIDTCEIVTETLGDVNLTTGQPTVTETTIYTGKCMVGSQGFPTDGDLQYFGFLPLDAAPIPARAILTITKAVADPNILGARYEVIGELVQTYSAYRGLTLVRRQQVGT